MPHEDPLVDVEFRTSLEAVYLFPDVPTSVVDRLISDFNYTVQVTLINVSGACLVVPARIVTTILVGGVQRWAR